MCGEGALAQACKALHKPAPLDPSSVLDEMKAKHPQAARSPDTSQLGAPNLGLVPQIAVDAVKSALQSSNKHSGDGPSALRPAHLRQALTPAHGDQVSEHLTSVINLLIRGQAQADMSRWFCGALLVAVPKKDGSARPIAVGEVLRRLAAKALCSSVRDKASSYLAPFQIGVAMPLGTEVGIQVARQWCLRNQASPGKVLL